MYDTQPTHKVILNNRDMYLDKNGIMHLGFFQVVPINQVDSGNDERMRGTFEECRAYADRLNERKVPEPVDEDELIRRLRFDPKSFDEIEFDK